MKSLKNWKSIEIVFTKSKLFMPIGSWAIRLWTQKPYSHVAHAVEIRDWGKRYYQANEGKVNYEYEKFFLKKHKIVKKYIIHVPKELDIEVKKACYQEAGNSYALMQNLGIVILDIVSFFTGNKLKNPWKKGKNCSEIVYEKVLKKLFLELNYNPDTIKPHHIEDILIKKGYKNEL